MHLCINRMSVFPYTTKWLIRGVSGVDKYDTYSRSKQIGYTSGLQVVGILSKKGTTIKFGFTGIDINSKSEWDLMREPIDEILSLNQSTEEVTFEKAASIILRCASICGATSVIRRVESDDYPDVPLEIYPEFQTIDKDGILDFFNRCIIRMDRVIIDNVHA